MPTFVVKPLPDEDFYVMWSTVVDAPVGFGSRATLGVDAERIDRADEYGTSMCDPVLARDQQWFGWDDDDGFLLGEVGPRREGGWYSIPRARLREMCERLDQDLDITDLLTFVADDGGEGT